MGGLVDILQSFTAIFFLATLPTLTIKNTNKHWSFQVDFPFLVSLSHFLLFSSEVVAPKAGLCCRTVCFSKHWSSFVVLIN